MYDDNDEDELSQSDAESMGMSVEDGFRLTDMLELQKMQAELDLLIPTGVGKSTLQKRLNKIKDNNSLRNRLKY